MRKSNSEKIQESPVDILRLVCLHLHQILETGCILRAAIIDMTSITEPHSSGTNMQPGETILKLYVSVISNIPFTPRERQTRHM